jgi:hypothetical protein
MANTDNTNTSTEGTETLTPIQFAAELREVLNPITGKNVPPQMVYNYLTNNVRDIRSYTTKVTRPNKDGKQTEHVVFPRDKADEFKNIMVEAATKRIAKRAAKAAEAEAANES